MGGLESDQASERRPDQREPGQRRSAGQKAVLIVAVLGVVAAGLAVVKEALPFFHPNDVKPAASAPPPSVEPIIPAPAEPAGPAAPPSVEPIIPRPVKPTEPPIRRTGSVKDLSPTSGVDLDLAVGEAVLGQDVRGVDVSGSRDGNQIYGMTNGKANMAVLADTGPETHARCAAVAAFADIAQNILQLRAGRNICVRTDEHRLSMLTIERPPTASDPSIGFRYRTWE